MFVSDLTIGSLFVSELFPTKVIINVIVKSPTSINSSCDDTNLTVHCYSVHKNEDDVDSYEHFSLIETNTTFNWTIEGFSEYTEYNCTFKLKNYTYTEIFTTLEIGQ